MKTLKNTFLLLSVLLYSHFTYSQNFTMLLIEDFEDGNTLFDLNLTGFGNNQWVVNNEYDGLGFYPNTPSQDSTVGGIGQIGAPGGNYMHIRNTSIPVFNANYNPLNSSERWAEMNEGFCTFGFSRIVLNFWWLGVGSPADYGEVYYSIDGGITWDSTISTTITGSLIKYSNQGIWKFASVEGPADPADPSFLNQADLRFAFKWTNDGINPTNTDSLPFSIDDIMIASYYDDYDASSIIATNFQFSPICHEDLNFPAFYFTVFDSMCEGTYIVELSDSSGNFINSTTIVAFTLPAFNPPASFWVPPSWQITFPTSIPFGSCYTFRIVRITPPIIVGAAYTSCIQIVDCPDNIVTNQPSVTMDPNYYPTNPANPPGMPADQQPVCNYSVIDVPFNSFGAYNPGNEYWLELSDSSGSFADTAYVIGGPMPSTMTFDPALPQPPSRDGSISGKIQPPFPPGCNYYVRVVSTNPPVNGTPWGPFCIKDCDIKTNEAIDITVCLTDTDTVCVSIPIDINTFDSTIFYNPGNQFIVQLLAAPDMMHTIPMAIVNEGGLGIIIDTVSGVFELCFPSFSDYLALIGDLGMHYMRIIATDGSDTTNLLGSLIRLTVTGVSGIPLIFDVQPASIICDTVDNLCITIYNTQVPTSEYIIQFSPGFLPFTWTPGLNGDPPWNTICFNVSNFPSGTYTVTVQEKVTGGECRGPLSAPFTFTVGLLPDVEISGCTTCCIGDTVTYTNNFSASTFYNWNFNGAGIGELLVFGNNDITIVWTSIGSAELKLQACNKCDNDVIYCNENSITINVLPASVAEITPDPVTICEGETVQLIAENIGWPISNNFSWILNGDTIRTMPIPFGNDTLSVSPNSTSTYIVKVDNGCTPDFDTVIVNVIPYPESAAICIDDTAQLNAFSEGVNEYQWFELPNTTTIISTDSAINVFPAVTTDYKVTFDSLCSHTITVTVNMAVVNAGDDKEIFRGDEVMLSASGGVTYSWVPAYGLSCTDCPFPTASPDTTTTYIVTITDIYGCVEQDTIIVKVILLEVPDAFTPDGDGINDVLYVYNLLGRGVDVTGDALESLDFKIFNRWGEVIFETTDINIGWDGKHMKTGRYMEVGVYVWLLTATTADGEDIGPMSGNVSLIR